MRYSYAYPRAHQHLGKVGDRRHPSSENDAGVRARPRDPGADLSEDGARDEGAEQSLRHPGESLDEIAVEPFLQKVADIFPRKLGFYLLFLWS